MFYRLLICSVLLQISNTKPTIDAKQILYEYGFLTSTNPNPATLRNAIKKFQLVNEMPVTGNLDQKTLRRMGAARCSHPPNTPEFLRFESVWEKRHLTYGIYNWSEPFTKSQVKSVLEKAIKAWTEKVNLQITESSSDEADILIYFTHQDGPHDVLGYAYYPESGDIYFDSDEYWTLSLRPNGTQINFRWVAVHELGHALGLPHSNFTQSIMFPYYSSENTDPSMSDIDEMIARYGLAVNNTALCRGTSINAILDTKDPMLIKGKEYWKLSNGVVESGPFSLDEAYPNLPEKIDAAFMVEKTSYFLSNNKFYKFNDKSKNPSTKLISVGFDNVPSRIDAAFYDPSSAYIYFFKGSKYYVLDTNKPVGERLQVNEKNMTGDWNGVPKNVEAATLITNSRILFIKKSRCYIVNLTSKQLLRNEDCKRTLYKC